MTDNAIERSAFVTTDSHWEWTRMPFGLCNAPLTFQSMMHQVLRDLIGQTCFVFIDDVVIYTRTFEEHVKAVEQVLQRFREHELYIKPRKCHYATERIKLLGFNIDGFGIL